MASAIAKSVRNGRNRRKNNNVTNPQPTTPIRITEAAAAGSVLTVTFDQPVSLNGVPAYTTDVVGATAVSAARTAADTVAITFSAAVAAATSVSVPYEEPAVRNSSGGFVADSSFPV